MIKALANLDFGVHDITHDFDVRVALSRRLVLPFMLCRELICVLEMRC